jgi:gamma-glutamylcysteine synthetase
MAHVPSSPSAADLDRLRQLKQRADSAGIRLSALVGDPAWTFDRATALAWQRHAVATGLFAAVHVDLGTEGRLSRP